VRNLSVGATLRLGQVLLQDMEASRADAACSHAMAVFSTQIQPPSAQGGGAGVRVGPGGGAGAVGGDFLTVSGSLFDRSAPDYCGWDIECRGSVGGLVAVVSAPFVNALNSWVWNAVCGRGEAPPTAGAMGGFVGASAPRDPRGARWDTFAEPVEPQEQHPHPMVVKGDLALESLDLVLVSVDQGRCQHAGLLRAMGLSAKYCSAAPPAGT
jgi:hypothetical protein